MYDFALVILMGLALFKVVDLLEDLAPQLTRWHLLATLVLAMGGAWMLDYSLFDRFDVGVRFAEIGTLVTGLMIAGTTSVWRAVFHWLGTSEGEEPSVRHPVKLHKAA